MKGFWRVLDLDERYSEEEESPINALSVRGGSIYSLDQVIIQVKVTRIQINWPSSSSEKICMHGSRIHWVAPDGHLGSGAFDYYPIFYTIHSKTICTFPFGLDA